jgi:hypothetical protein
MSVSISTRSFVFSIHSFASTPATPPPASNKTMCILMIWKCEKTYANIEVKTKFWYFFCSSEWLGTEFRKFFVSRNRRNSNETLGGPFDLVWSSAKLFFVLEIGNPSQDCWIVVDKLNLFFKSFWVQPLRIAALASDAGRQSRKLKSRSGARNRF